MTQRFFRWYPVSASERERETTINKLSRRVYDHALSIFNRARIVVLAWDIADNAVLVKEIEQALRRAGLEEAELVASGIDISIFDPDTPFDMIWAHASTRLRTSLVRRVIGCIQAIIETEGQGLNFQRCLILDGVVDNIVFLPGGGSTVPQHQFGEADAAVWHHALHAKTSVVVVCSTDTDALLRGLLALFTGANIATATAPSTRRWYVLWHPGGGDASLFSLPQLAANIGAMLPPAWPFILRVGSIVAAAIASGNDFKERLGPYSPHTVIGAYSKHCDVVGTLVNLRFDSTTDTLKDIVLNGTAVRGLMHVMYAGGKSAPNKTEEIAPRAALNGIPGAYAVRAAVARAAAAFEYASVTVRRESAMPAARWLCERDGARGWVSFEGRIHIVWDVRAADDKYLLGPSPDGKTLRLPPTKRAAPVRKPEGPGSPQKMDGTRKRAFRGFINQ